MNKLIKMLTERIKTLIREYNPWWEEKKVAVPEYKRHIFERIKKYMKTKQIIAIVGLRRVGKTVLLKQIIKEIKNKKNVFYFLFDELVAQTPDVLEDIIEYYLKTVAARGKKYIFLDEIQKVPYWQEILKRFYDSRDDIKFIISGSSSLKIKKSKESLAGRIFDFFMPVLTFREFLELKGFKTEKVEINPEKLATAYENKLHKKEFYEKMFLEYMFKGAFPEIVNEEDEEIIKNYIRSSVIERIILEDIPAVFEARRQDVLAYLLEYLGKETANLLDINSLAKSLNVNYETAKSYVFYLKNSFVIDLVYNYSKSIVKQLRKNKKAHIAHPSISIALMGYSKDVLNIEEIASRYAETIVFQHAKLLSERVFFWRTPQKQEVDVIIELDTLLPIEVKFKTAVSDIKGIINFMEKYKLKNGIIVTRDVFEKRKINGKNILLIPIWLFLLTV
jgi:predicted AAA+ superfamily ATPase